MRTLVSVFIGFLVSLSCASPLHYICHAVETAPFLDKNKTEQNFRGTAPDKIMQIVRASAASRNTAAQVKHLNLFNIAKLRSMYNAQQMLDSQFKVKKMAANHNDYWSYAPPVATQDTPLQLNEASPEEREHAHKREYAENINITEYMTNEDNRNLIEDSNVKLRNNNIYKIRMAYQTKPQGLDFATSDQNRNKVILTAQGLKNYIAPAYRINNIAQAYRKKYIAQTSRKHNTAQSYSKNNIAQRYRENNIAQGHTANNIQAEKHRYSHLYSKSKQLEPPKKGGRTVDLNVNNFPVHLTNRVMIKDQQLRLPPFREPSTQLHQIGTASVDRYGFSRGGGKHSERKLRNSVFNDRVRYNSPIYRSNRRQKRRASWETMKKYISVKELGRKNDNQPMLGSKDLLDFDYKLMMNEQNFYDRRSRVINPVTENNKQIADASESIFNGKNVKKNAYMKSETADIDFAAETGDLNSDDEIKSEGQTYMKVDQDSLKDLYPDINFEDAEGNLTPYANRQPETKSLLLPDGLTADSIVRHYDKLSYNNNYLHENKSVRFGYNYNGNGKRFKLSKNLENSTKSDIRKTSPPDENKKNYIINQHVLTHSWGLKDGGRGNDNYVLYKDWSSKKDEGRNNILYKEVKSSTASTLPESNSEDPENADPKQWSSATPIPIASPVISHGKDLGQKETPYRKTSTDNKANLFGSHTNDQSNVAPEPKRSAYYSETAFGVDPEISDKEEIINFTFQKPCRSNTDAILLHKNYQKFV